jgi:Ca2+-transporting ATPase
MSLLTHALVVYLPVLQSAFHTVALPAFDWALATAVASTLLIVTEIAKLAMRAPHRGALAPQP